MPSKNQSDELFFNRYANYRQQSKFYIIIPDSKCHKYVMFTNKLLILLAALLVTITLLAPLEASCLSLGQNNNKNGSPSAPLENIKLKRESDQSKSRLSWLRAQPAERIRDLKDLILGNKDSVYKVNIDLPIKPGPQQLTEADIESGTSGSNEDRAKSEQHTYELESHDNVHKTTDQQHQQYNAPSTASQGSNSYPIPTVGVSSNLINFDENLIDNGSGRRLLTTSANGALQSMDPAVFVPLTPDGPVAIQHAGKGASDDENTHEQATIVADYYAPSVRYYAITDGRSPRQSRQVKMTNQATHDDAAAEPMSGQVSGEANILMPVEEFGSAPVVSHEQPPVSTTYIGSGQDVQPSTKDSALMSDSNQSGSRDKSQLDNFGSDSFWPSNENEPFSGFGVRNMDNGKQKELQQRQHYSGKMSNEQSQLNRGKVELEYENFQRQQRNAMAPGRQSLMPVSASSGLNSAESYHMEHKDDHEGQHHHDDSEYHDDGHHEIKSKCDSESHGHCDEKLKKIIVHKKEEKHHFHHHHHHHHHENKQHPVKEAVKKVHYSQPLRLEIHIKGKGKGKGKKKDKGKGKGKGKGEEDEIVVKLEHGKTGHGHGHQMGDHGGYHEESYANTDHSIGDKKSLIEDDGDGNKAEYDAGGSMVKEQSPSRFADAAPIVNEGDRSSTDSDDKQLAEQTKVQVAGKSSAVTATSDVKKKAAAAQEDFSLVINTSQVPKHYADLFEKSGSGIDQVDASLESAEKEVEKHQKEVEEDHDLMHEKKSEETARKVEKKEKKQKQKKVKPVKEQRDEKNQHQEHHHEEPKHEMHYYGHEFYGGHQEQGGQEQGGQEQGGLEQGGQEQGGQRENGEEQGGLGQGGQDQGGQAQGGQEQRGQEQGGQEQGGQEQSGQEQGGQEQGGQEQGGQEQGGQEQHGYHHGDHKHLEHEEQQGNVEGGEQQGNEGGGHEKKKERVQHKEQKPVEKKKKQEKKEPQKIIEKHKKPHIELHEHKHFEHHQHINIPHQEKHEEVHNEIGHPMGPVEPHHEEEEIAKHPVPMMEHHPEMHHQPDHNPEMHHQEPHQPEMMHHHEPHQEIHHYEPHQHYPDMPHHEPIEHHPEMHHEPIKEDMHGAIVIEDHSELEKHHIDNPDSAEHYREDIVNHPGGYGLTPSGIYNLMGMHSSPKASHTDKGESSPIKAALLGNKAITKEEKVQRD